MWQYDTLHLGLPKRFSIKGARASSEKEAKSKFRTDGDSIYSQFLTFTASLCYGKSGYDVDLLRGYVASNKSNVK